MKCKKFLACILAAVLMTTGEASLSLAMASEVQSEGISWADESADCATVQNTTDTEVIGSGTDDGTGQAEADANDESADDFQEECGTDEKTAVTDCADAETDSESTEEETEELTVDAANDSETLAEENDEISTDAEELVSDEITVTDEAEVLYSSFTYTPTYTSLSFTSAGGISADTILEKAESVIISNEGDYTSVNANDNGALSIGKMQWHGTRALNLLKTILSYNNTAAKKILGSTLYNEIVSATSWSTRTLTSSEKSLIQSLLATNYGKAAQDALADSDVSVYLNRGYKQGIRNAAALVYYADIENQYGSGGSTVCGNYAYKVAGSNWDKVTLNELHIAAICYIYKKYSSDSTRFSSAYIPRRRTTYGVISGYGWTYCNSGDYIIPYGSVWSTNVGTKWLQTALNKYQSAGLTVDGSYGSATTAAVKTFQTSAGLTADGYAGAQTVSLLIYKLYYNVAVNGATSIGTASATTDVVKNSSTGKWVYTVNGVADYTYTGFAKNSNGWWYIEKGVVTFKKNSVIKGTVNGTEAWWYVVGSKVQTSFTGLANYKNENGWWYIENGKVTFTKNTVAKNKNGWYYVVGSKVQFGYTGLANYKNEYGWWYIKNGKVDFTKNTVAKNKNGWWYVVGGKVQFGYTGLANYKNENGWWYIKNGKVSFKYSGIAKNKNGWWYLQGGKVIFSYTGYVKVASGTYYVKNGKVNR